ncbi:DNA methyltransferase [Pontibacter sp. BAB1700]|uniref:Eco57I restriction-modification methylase domain-containing protein n=1 Tax=Pontibacter sp. BAB1700 TaxID=1144253 RepID=UPI00026BE0B0|nr:DNA methyltransferase [Pontibacter sp. BAB1700]EJF10768.1 hypothetical protein O71_07159 [Pontibacter sp. BAB1700]
MNYPSINIQGNIISSEVIDKIRNDDDFKHQQAAAFGFERGVKVRDEIGLAWSAARSYWQAFKMKMERVAETTKSGTTETRNLWVLPLLSTLGYELESSRAEMVNDKSFAISHRATNLKGLPVHIMGINDNLDQRRETGGPRLSPHALAQEYINSTEHVYALVCNGRYLRLLRDATRLVRLSYLEFDLEKMMEEELYADFAALFRLLHATRMPKQSDQATESFIEYYHQESLASGSRIREKLSIAVENSIKELANGFLKHPDNKAIVKNETIVDGDTTVYTDVVLNGKLLTPADYYLYQLRLIYRLLFLIVTEERNLVYPDTKDEELQRKRNIYYDFYSIERLRKLAAKAHYVDGRKHDLWEGLNSTFLLFEKSHFGEKLGIKPLGSGLFSPSALGELPTLKLDNKTLLDVIRHLTLFRSEHGHWVRVNYSDLDVEEFGSVYEGLLEFDATFISVAGKPAFTFVEGTGRSSSGSHYTPEELVKPLIKHSLEYVIEDKLKQPNKEAALLSIKVCDVACGSGHILLSAARRIATELARVRTNEDQPTPSAMRHAIRDVIKNCIYGVDKNPLAVELCKVALWLEAHNPGEPLNFLDHHIKCGDAIVGLAHKEELQRGIADEAFKALPGDDKEVARAYAKRNKVERDTRGQATLDFDGNIGKGLENVLQEFQKFSQLPETTPEEIEKKSAAYNKLIHSGALQRLKALADLQVAQFFIPKTSANKDYLVTDANYFQYLKGTKAVPTTIETRTIALTAEKRFFHWFLEFPEVFQQGGFSCILGNPPYLWGNRISSHFGDDYRKFLNTNKPFINGNADFCCHFVDRIATIIEQNGFFALITTSSINETDNRTSSLEVLLERQFRINYALPKVKWPGKASLLVTLLALSRNNVKSKYIGSKQVDSISAFLDDSSLSQTPEILKANENLSFKGVDTGGMGFVMSKEEFLHLSKYDEYREYLFDYLNADTYLNEPAFKASGKIINVTGVNIKELNKLSHIEQVLIERVLPYRQTVKDKSSRENWWLYNRPRPNLYNAIKNLNCCLINGVVSKYNCFSFYNTKTVFTNAINVFAFDKHLYLAFLQSTIHGCWSDFLGSSLGITNRYNPTDCFETYPFPSQIYNSQEQALEDIAKSYDVYRQQVMLKVQLGLTKTYNLFHSDTLRAITATEAGLEDKAFEKLVGKEAAQLRKHLAKTPGTITFNEAVAGIEKLRQLHVQMDEAVLEAYGWQDIQLRHDFYELEYLPENDRIRYTIHPDARKEVLKRLLELNHQIHEEEVKAGLWDKKGSSKKKAAAKAPKAAKAKQPTAQADLFEANTPLFAKTVNHQVQEGSKVTLGHTGGQRMKYAILPNAQKDILTTDGYKQILPTSGLAQVLLGKQPGVKVEFGGNVYEVLEVV